MWLRCYLCLGGMYWHEMHVKPRTGDCGMKTFLLGHVHMCYCVDLDSYILAACWSQQSRGKPNPQPNSSQKFANARWECRESSLHQDMCVHASQVYFLFWSPLCGRGCWVGRIPCSGVPPIAHQPSDFKPTALRRAMTGKLSRDLFGMCAGSATSTPSALHYFCESLSL